MKNYLQKISVLSLFLSLLSINILTAQKIIEQGNSLVQSQIVLNPESVLSNCEQSTAQIDLDVNNVRARLLVGGGLWQDGNDGLYNVPKQSAGAPQVSAVYAGGLWMSGLGPSGNLKVAAQTYGGNGTSDYWPGPLNDEGLTETDVCLNFDRFWEVTSGSINTHINDWEDNGVIDGPVPNTILSWPGLGNPEFLSANGFVLPFAEQGYAPFVDRNGDGVYDPMQGDYPNINGADQGIWWVFNDAGNIHIVTGGDPLHMEIQVLAHAYVSASPSINNTTFYDYKFINKSNEPISDAYIGVWIDFDLGCFSDDYIGCDSTENLAYVYNSDALDGISSCTDCSGVNTYCEDIPIVGLKMLEGLKDIENGQIVDRKMSSFIYYNSDGPFPSSPSDALPPSYNNLMKATFPDGTRLTRGGNGYDPNSSDYTNYAFHDAPSNQNGWSMCAENIPDSDRRVLVNSGPFTIHSGSVNSMCFAIVYAENIAHPCPNIDPLISAADEVEAFYVDQITSTKEQVAEEPANIELIPNPMTNQAELIFKELEHKVLQVGIFSIDGRQVQTYDSPSGNRLTINRKNLSPGIYFYKLLTEDYKLYSGKFIIQ